MRFLERKTRRMFGRRARAGRASILAFHIGAGSVALLSAASGYVLSAATAYPLNWIISRNTRYPSPEIMARTGAAGCVGCEDLVGQPVIPQLNQSSVTVPLATPGERYPERNNLLSISATKQVDLGAVRLEFQADVFNLLNTDAIEVLRTTLGSRYGQPTRVLWARYLELATRVRW